MKACEQSAPCHERMTRCCLLLQICGTANMRLVDAVVAAGVPRFAFISGGWLFRAGSTPNCPCLGGPMLPAAFARLRSTPPDR